MSFGIFTKKIRFRKCCKLTMEFSAFPSFPAFYFFMNKDLKIQPDCRKWNALTVNSDIRIIYVCNSSLFARKQ